MIIKFLLVLIITQSSVGSFSKNSIVLQENFNIDTFPPNGWRSVVLAGSHNWERRSSNINPPCLPFEGSGMASYPSYAAPEGSKARLITRPINLGRGLYACSLSFYMFHDPGYSDCADRIVVEVSQNLSNFIPIDSILRYRPGASSWIEHKLFLGNFTDSIYLSFLAYSEYGNNMNIDFVRITATKLIAGYDVGIDKITAPLSFHGINTPLIPKAVVKNYGYRVQENFYVVCSIFGADTKHHLYYTDSVLISYLPYNASAFINFSPWLP
ncbi:MAG: hypothetical protein NZ601_02385, partial [candidate division WOR-3 bacterium]|nr:hypothetical protein [candidate division WOR-3 bacterium]MDW7988194.1 hypothetical protein [candidate division WOR-3 bacterium]